MANLILLLGDTSKNFRFLLTSKVFLQASSRLFDGVDNSARVLKFKLREVCEMSDHFTIH